MKKYDSYKDSGIEWIGQIPSHWDKVLFKRVFEKIKDGTHGSFSRVEEGRPFLSAKNVYDFGLVISENESLISEEDFNEITKNGFPSLNDLLITCVGTIGRTCVYKYNEPYAFQRSVSFLRLNQKGNPNFYKCFVQSDLYQNQLINLAKTSAQSGVYMNDLANSIILLPPLNEQTAIANYLDQKTTQIDHLITKKEQFIQLLEEERVAVINQAVTKGLDPNVAMKDSGIDWLGKIPKHWDVKIIKHTTYVKGRIGWKGLRSDEFLEFSDSYVVTGTDFHNGTIKWETCYQVPIDRYEDDPFIKLQNDDLLITKDGTIGKIAIVKDMPKIATLNSGVFLTRPLENEYYQEFMYWILYSEVFKSFYDFNKSGSTIQHLYQNVFNEFKYPLPPTKEQIEIVNHVNKKTDELDLVISKTKQEIELLKEYKTALISEVVTGKVDVRNEKLN